MSTYFDKTKFVFCNENEAKAIANDVEKLNNYYKGKADYTYYCEAYDDSNKGIIVGYSKRNSSYDDFSYLDSKFKTLYIVYGDGDDSYTNDYNHVIFPKYIVDGDEFKNADEIINHYREKANWSDDEVEQFKTNFALLRDCLELDLDLLVEEIYDA